MSVYEYTHPSLEDPSGAPVSLQEYQGKVLVLVNVASRCGLTPHYEGLQALYEAHADEGLVVLGFPCNQFGAQEPGTEAEIKQFCESKYNVTFPMFAKLEVNGPSRHPLYAYLTGLDTTPDGPGDITWNFAKFVVGRDGEVIARFSPRTAPEDQAFVNAINGALAAS